MTCAQALVSLFLLTPCNDAEIAGAVDGAGGSGAIAAAVANPARPESDRERDAGRKPSAVLSYFGIKPGMAVLEVFAGGGYYTQILDSVVGSKGKVLAHNNQGYLNYVGAEFNGRFTGAGLPNSEQLIAEANDVNLADGSLDATLLVLAWHDFLFGAEEWNWPDVDENAFVDSLCSAMKPGAVLGIVDHVANPGGDATDVAFKLHRIDPELIKENLAGSCFTLQGESSLLRNTNDDHTTSATEGPLKGNTDRFILKYVRN